MKIIITMFLMLSLSAVASELQIKSVILNDNTIVNGNEISQLHPDYLELFEGSRIESTEIQKINFNKIKVEMRGPSVIRGGGGEESGG